MDDVPSIVGLVLAGGRSSRFGTEKATALLGGLPLLQWATDRLARTCREVAVSARLGSGAEGLARARGQEVLFDAPGEAEGPLSGIKAGLTWARSRGATLLAVSPCDVPGLPDELYPRLVAAAGRGAAMAQTREGRQPLCAVWPVTALPVLSQALAGGGHPATWRVLEAIGAQLVLFDPPEAFANLNTREDLQRLEARWAAGSYQR